MEIRGVWAGAFQDPQLGRLRQSGSPPFYQFRKKAHTSCCEKHYLRMRAAYTGIISGCLGAVTFASNFFNFCYSPVLSEVGGVGFRTPRFDNGPAK